MQTPSGHPVESTSAQRVVVLVSGLGSNLAALLAAHEEASYGARVVGVVTDNPAAGALDLARDAGVASVVVSTKDFEDRAAWNVGLAEAVAVFQPDLVVLAGFMRILAPTFVRRFEGRIINTHPALLPSFPGAHGVRDALAHGVKVTGCTVHVMTEEMDEGPILAQEAVPVLPDDDEQSLHERIKAVERRLYPDTIRAVLADPSLLTGTR